MIKIENFKHYPGGKNGNGTYQQIINIIPYHSVWYSGFLGLCAVTRRKKPAHLNILVELNQDLCFGWDNAVRDLKQRFQVLNEDSITNLESKRVYIDGGVPVSLDEPRTFLFLDPPYLKDTRKSEQDIYLFELETKDHERIVQAIIKYKNAMIGICAYQNELYDRVLLQENNWDFIDYESQTRHGKAIERFYFNYKLSDNLHDYHYIGKDFKQRQKHKRAKENAIAKFDRMDKKLRNSVLIDIIEYYGIDHS